MAELGLLNNVKALGRRPSPTGTQDRQKTSPSKKLSPSRASDISIWQTGKLTYKALRLQKEGLRRTSQSPDGGVRAKENGFS